MTEAACTTTNEEVSSTTNEDLNEEHNKHDKPAALATEECSDTLQATTPQNDHEQTETEATEEETNTNTLETLIDTTTAVAEETTGKKRQQLSYQST